MLRAASYVSVPGILCVCSRHVFDWDAAQVLAPFAIGGAVFLAHLVAVCCSLSSSYRLAVFIRAL